MRVYGLIGYPLGHSFSRNYFSEKFKNAEISDCKYENFPIDSIHQLPDLIASESELTGLNVTIPYKEKVLPFLDQIDDEAQNIGAVNTIKIERSEDAFQLKGYNTDEYGFRESLVPLLNPGVKNALVLGTGGASRAVVHALGKLGITPHLVSRAREKGDFCYADLDRGILKEHLLIVNTTPLGTFPDIMEYPPVPYEYITTDHILYDLIYNPSLTFFLKQGKNRGAGIKNGHEMLVLQAEKSWEIWNG